MDALLAYVRLLVIGLFGLFDLVVGRFDSDGDNPGTTEGAPDELW